MWFSWISSDSLVRNIYENYCSLFRLIHISHWLWHTNTAPSHGKWAEECSSKLIHLHVMPSVGFLSVEDTSRRNLEPHEVSSKWKRFQQFVSMCEDVYVYQELYQVSWKWDWFQSFVYVMRVLYQFSCLYISYPTCFFVVVYYYHSFLCCDC